MSLAAPFRRLAPDVAVVVAAPLLVFWLASSFEWYERFASATRPLERWQLDEALFALGSLALALVWFSWRRLHEARRAQAQAATLLDGNRELSRSLIELQETERRRIARELHDELGQRCHSIRLDAALISRQVEGGPVADAAWRIDGAAGALDDQLRTMLRRLRPAELDMLGLVPALRALCEQWSRSSQVACRFHPSGSLDRLGDAANVALYRVVQEALSNIGRHARARQVDIRLGHHDGTIELTIRDDGQGFDPSAPRSGLGLVGLRERAAMLGGSLRVDSGFGVGTALTLHVPSYRAVP